MRHFDDIPISKIQKMPGYQTGSNMLDDGAADNNNGGLGPAPAGNLEDDEAQHRPIEERA